MRKQKRIQNFDGETEGMKPLGRLGCKFNDIKMGLKET
jgi:hypothetical protein